MTPPIDLPPPGDDAATAERALASGYTPAASRSAVAALFQLDRRLGGIVRSTREPMVGQMRLTWWHDALTRLGEGTPPAEPVLATLAGVAGHHGVGGADMAGMIDGWEALLDGPVTDEGVLLAHARGRGGVLFDLAGRLVGHGGEPLVMAGEGWALADLAANLSDPAAAALARRLANGRLAPIMTGRWSRATRGLGAMALLARMDTAADARPAGHPLRVARLLRHRLTGY